MPVSTGGESEDEPGFFLRCELFFVVFYKG